MVVRVQGFRGASKADLKEAAAAAKRAHPMDYYLGGTYKPKPKVFPATYVVRRI